ncbi:MAG: nitroreductase family protein [Methanomassiliicoccales archaeon]|jgi:nitroreductase|nr:nitroreductase family protein [Methanomassiliicoccales archaeon]
MELLECIQKRMSVRSFSDEPVPEEVLLESIRIGNLAPSAGNLQARDFIIVTNKDTKRKLVDAAHGQGFLAEAPVVIVCCANLQRIRSYGRRGVELYCLQDVAAAVENMLLYFVDKGYASCWVGAFDESAVSKILALPSHIRPVAMLPVGKPRGVSHRTSRLNLENIVHWEKW